MSGEDSSQVKNDAGMLFFISFSMTGVNTKKNGLYKKQAMTSYLCFSFTVKRSP